MSKPEKLFFVLSVGGSFDNMHEEDGLQFLSKIVGTMRTGTSMGQHPTLSVKEARVSVDPAVIGVFLRGKPEKADGRKTPKPRKTTLWDPTQQNAAAEALRKHFPKQGPTEIGRLLGVGRIVFSYLYNSRRIGRKRCLEIINALERMQPPVPKDLIFVFRDLADPV